MNTHHESAHSTRLLKPTGTKNHWIALQLTLLSPVSCLIVSIAITIALLAIGSFELASEARNLSLLAAVGAVLVLCVLWTHFITLVDDWDTEAQGFRTAKWDGSLGCRELAIGDHGSFGARYSDGDIARLQWLTANPSIRPKD